ncbi:hypothetical protein AURDEDRAFT_175132 [Auricularia subglabra TFB-10046 SS5]|nr:hypothetical protein AURDEDRAFT_175132 [Auricularia subglabra TFB-10046 SS5]
MSTAVPRRKDVVQVRDVEVAREDLHPVHVRDDGRSWRNIALSDRSLWDEYSVPELTTGVSAEIGLPAMLARSYPVPFRLTLSAELSEEVMELLVSNMPRIRVLRLDSIPRDTVLRLMAHDAPVLERFSYHWSPEPDAAVEIGWSGAQAPCLRVMALGRFVLPRGDVYRAMRLFHGTLPEGHCFPAPLDSMFPNLTDISLDGVTQASLALLSPLPRSMKSVSLMTTQAGPIDYAEFHRGCGSASLSYLRIDSASSISIAVNQLLQANTDPWELYLGGGNDKLVGLYTAQEIDYCIHCHERPSLVHQPDLMSYLHRVSRLSLPLLDYEALYHSTMWPRILPLLTHLTVMFDPEDINRQQDLSSRLPVQAPALNSVLIMLDRVSIRVQTTSSVRYAGSVVRSLAVPRLIDIVLIAQHPWLMLQVDASSLKDVARSVSVRSVDTQETKTIWISDALHSRV